MYFLAVSLTHVQRLSFPDYMDKTLEDENESGGIYDETQS